MENNNIHGIFGRSRWTELEDRLSQLIRSGAPRAAIEAAKAAADQEWREVEEPRRRRILAEANA